MQVSASLLCLMLTAAAVSVQVLAQADMKDTNETPLACCLTLTHRKIPLNYLKGYELTSDKCPLTAVIFKTRRNIQICADPTKKWVQHAMVYLNDLKT
ncbi:C-C motif chemokine 2-like [Cavia porcellus]|uniref:C-C motif chemokine n=1 Tax=Cavia porcellus TaxID=10141 RepID=A0A286XNL7_CAVPO|nr:C-C motif chemokine 2-like [Cavia porcellus]